MSTLTSQLDLTTTLRSCRSSSGSPGSSWCGACSPRSGPRFATSGCRGGCRWPGRPVAGAPPGHRRAAVVQRDRGAVPGARALARAAAASPQHLGLRGRPCGHPDAAQRARRCGRRTDATGPRREKIYVVRPPEGRYHESLWEIAENHLGDGRRYAEIFRLNEDQMQPDGTKLTIASLIRPGWVLRMPATPTGRASSTVDRVPGHGATAPARARHRPPPRPRTRQPARGRDQAPATGGTGTAAANLAGTVRPVKRSAGTGAATGRVAVAAFPYGPAAPCSRRECSRRSGGGGGSGCGSARSGGGCPPLMATRRPRARCGPAPTTRPSRCSTSACGTCPGRAARGKPPPTVFAALLPPGQLRLWIAPPDTDPPAPWTAEDGGRYGG